MKKITKPRVIVAALGLAALAGLTVASATSLSLQANHDLAAGASVTQSCQTGVIGVGFDTPAWAPGTQKFTVSSTTLSNIEASCNGKNAKIVVADATGAALAQQTAVIAPTAGAQSFALGAAIDSVAVASINVVIY